MADTVGASVARARAKKDIGLRQARSSSLTGTLLQREHVRLQAEHFSLHSFEVVQRGPHTRIGGRLCGRRPVLLAHVPRQHHARLNGCKVNAPPRHRNPLRTRQTRLPNQSLRLRNKLLERFAARLWRIAPEACF